MVLELNKVFAFEVLLVFEKERLSYCFTWSALTNATCLGTIFLHIRPVTSALGLHIFAPMLPIVLLIF